MMLATKLNFEGSPSAQIGPQWWDAEFHPITRLHGQLTGLGASNQESHPELVRAAEALYSAAGFRADCSEGVVSSGPGTHYYDRSCSLDGGPRVHDVDNIATSYPTGIPAYMVSIIRNEVVREHGGSGTALESSSFTPAVINAAGQIVPVQQAQSSGTSSAPTMTDDQEIAAAQKIYMDLLSSYGVAANPAVTSLANADIATGLAWYKSTYGTYKGLSAFVRANADSVVRGWISKAGVSVYAPPTSSKADGTATKPTPGATTQPGNVDTTGNSGQQTTSQDGGSDTSSIALVIGGIALLMLMGEQH